VKNPDISVSDLAAQVGKELGDTITIVAFDRYALGETSEATDEAC